MATPSVVSSDIREKLSLFQNQEETISRLETQLADLKQQHEELRTELAPYLRRYAAPYNDSHQVEFSLYSTVLKADIPVHRCPDEVLQMIFKEYLTPNHTHIKTLLLVCRHWHQVVMNTPMLWTRIQITYSADLLELVAKRSLVPYVDACMERSKGLPLHVQLNMYDLPTREEYLQYEVVALLETVVDKNQRKSIDRCLSRAEFYLKSTLYSQKLTASLEGIFGVNNAHLARWATVSLKLPDEADYVEGVWDRFADPALQLTGFEVRYIPKNRPLETRLNLRTVERLKVPDPIPLSMFDISPRKLIHLNIGFDKTLVSLEGLSSLTSLRTLTLTFRTESMYNFPPLDGASMSICLPQLRAITLVGNSTPLSTINFELPALTTLTLEAKSKFIAPPKLSAKHIHWYIDIKSPKNQGRSEGAVDILLSLSSATESITVQGFARSGLLKAVARHLENGTAPALEQLFVEHENGWLEKIAAHDAPQLLATMIPEIVIEAN